MRSGGPRQRAYDAQALVREFHEAFRLGAPDGPTLDGFPGDLRVRLIEEELDEFRQAVANSDVVEMIDALCDLLYVTYGAAVALGVDIDPFFDEVHRANMSKRGAAQRDDGKQLKPVDWKAPRIAELLESLYRSGLERRVDHETGHKR